MTDLATKAVQRLFEHHNIPAADITPNDATGIRLGLLMDQAVKASNMAEQRYEWGIFDFRPYDFILNKHDQAIRLTEKESALLEVLVKAGGKAVSRDDLLRHVWRYAPDVETHTLETHIYRLRQKIEDDPATPEIVVTDGDGYRLKGL